MFDARLRRVINPVLNSLATAIAKTGMTANVLTLIGAVLGLAAGLAIATQYYQFALLLVITNRIADGLDGAIARINGPSLWGGYILCCRAGGLWFVRRG
jgi:phosphatidylglycerophosphate synthase